MIFTPEAVQLIRERRKSQLRLPAGPERQCELQPGRTYTVQPGRGQRGVFPITILTVQRAQLGDLSRADALREGFRFERQFYDHWQARYGRVDLGQTVWVITFAFGDVRDRFDRPRLLRAAAPHAPICACGRGLPDHATVCPRCGAVQPPATTAADHGYTDRTTEALRGEPEAIDERTQQRYSTQARARDAAARPRQQEAQARTLGQRLRQEALTSLRSGADIEPELAEIQRQLASIERKRQERKDADFRPSARRAIVRHRPVSRQVFTAAQHWATTRRASKRPRPFRSSRRSV